MLVCSGQSADTTLFEHLIPRVCTFLQITKQAQRLRVLPLFLHFHRYKHTPSPPAVKQLLLGHKNFFLFFFFSTNTVRLLPLPPPLLHTAAFHRVLLKYLRLCRREPQTCCNHRITVFSLFSRLSPPHWKKKRKKIWQRFPSNKQTAVSLKAKQGAAIQELH